MTQIRLLHVLYSGQGGLGSYFMGFVKNDVANYFEHHALFYGVEPLLDEYRSFCSGRQIQFEYHKRTSRIDWKGYRNVASYVKKHQIEIILIHTASLTPALFFLDSGKIKSYFIDHTSPAFKTKVEWLYSLVAYGKADIFFYFVRDQLASLKFRFPWIQINAARFIQLTKQADLEKYHPGKEDHVDAAIVAGMAARMVPGKLQGLLIRAVGLLRKEGLDIRLVLAGDGPNRQALVELTNSLGLAAFVTFCGNIQSADMLSFYQNLDVYVHATLGETICLSILEAQACGLPIAASAVSGVKDGFDHGETALLFENSESSIAFQIKKLMQTPDLAKKLSVASLRLAKSASAKPDPEVIYSVFKSR